MKLLRAATVTVADLDRSIANYSTCLGYSLIERGLVPADLAASWDTPASAGSPFAILAPESGADIYLRFIEQPPVEGYKALRSFGWNAVEICVTDVLAVNEKMLGSPFEIIGPPRKIEGLDAIYPMQVKGPDEEIVYLTQINDDLPEYDLPRAASLIDKLFILVLGCSDMRASLSWMEKHIGLSKGREMEIVYTMLAKAYDKPMDTTYLISTMTHDRDVFLELDQYPKDAIQRPHHPQMLPPCCAIGTLHHPDFDSLPGPWVTPPVVRSGPIYQDKRVATIKDPDGTLIEMVEG